MSKSDKSKAADKKAADKKAADKKNAGKKSADKKKSTTQSKSTPNAKGKPTPSAPWYVEGLRFTCTQCGDCCSGDPGFVWVNQAEIDAMAEVMELEVDEFERKFVRQVGKDRSLVEYPDGDCILLDPETRRCTVYHARPIQCRTWPFWDSNLKRKKDWQETCDVCPGAGTGRLYTLDQIEVARKEKSV